MVAIDVDFEVFKALTVRRRSEDMTANDVLREVLSLPTPAKRADAPTPGDGGGAWTPKGVTFPYGTEFRATYKGQQYTAVAKNGALVLNGKRYSSPSAAAVSITKNAVNGWRFWECLAPGSTEWRSADDVRHSGGLRL
jgi:hypothetical protein